ncbi:MAG: M48 family metallopeptidase [Patescibacteria group bacterium]
MVNVYEAVSANKNKSMLVMLLFVVFVTAAIYFISLGMGYYFGFEPGGLGIVGIAFIVSGLMSLGSYYFSDKIVLSISGARPADRKRDFNFYTIAENLSLASGLPKPKLYVIDDSAPNAFATGRDPDHAVVVATTGLLDKLTRTELEGVIAHELSHVKNYDTRLMSIVAVLVGTIALLGDWFLRMTWNSDSDNDSKNGGIFIIVGLVFALLSPIIGQLIQLAISRRREYLADASSVSLTRQPSGLISALQKIAADHEPLEAANKATAHMYIVNPFKGHEKRAVSWFANLFNTHPPMEQRISALKKME